MNDDHTPLDEYEYHLYEEARSGRMTRRELIRRAGVMGLSLPVISVIAAACNGGNNTTASPSGTGAGTTTLAGPAKRGGTARFGSPVPTTTPDPVTMFDEGSIQAAQLAGEYLCWPAVDYSLEPRLATSWKATTPSEWTFKLRQGVKFHNGTTMTADDVVSTLDLLTNKDNGSSFLSQAKGILEPGQTEKVDDYTVKFHLSQPFADFPYLMCSFNYNSMILPKGYVLGSFLKKPQGTGAFIVTSYVPNQSVTYKKNPDYWDKTLPYLDGVKLSFYQSDQSLLLATQGGELDVTAQIPYGGAQTLGHSANVHLLPTHTSSFNTLQMRTDTPPFDDVNKRLAVAACLDRPQIVSTVLTGYGQPANDHPFAPIFPVSGRAIKEVAQRKQDYPLAKKYLAKAGTPRGFPATLTIESYLDQPAFATAVKQQCAKVGIDIGINQESQTAYYGSGKNQPWLTVPFGITGWAERGTPAQSILTAFQSDGIWNSAHWKNARYTALFKQLCSTLDEGTRATTAAEMAKIQNAEVPDVIAYWITELRATGTNVHGLAAGPAEYVDARSTWIG